MLLVGHLAWWWPFRSSWGRPSFGRRAMSRRRTDPLRALTDDERTRLEEMGRATSAPARLVTRARALLAVAAGCSYTEAARRVGRRSGDAVGELVARFNREG